MLISFKLYYNFIKNDLILTLLIIILIFAKPDLTIKRKKPKHNKPNH